MGITLTNLQGRFRQSPLKNKDWFHLVLRWEGLFSGCFGSFWLCKRKLLMCIWSFHTLRDQIQIQFQFILSLTDLIKYNRNLFRKNRMATVMEIGEIGKKARKNERGFKFSREVRVFEKKEESQGKFREF